MSLFRWIVGFPFAALVTLALFFMMAQLIREKDRPYATPRDDINLRITAEMTDTEPEVQKPPRETIPKDIPQTILDFSTKLMRPDPRNVRAQPTPVERTPPGDAGKFAGPTIRISPAYPEGCRSRGAEGRVVVQFDITPEGSISNAKVIETPDRCFVRPILKAISGWKYPPAGAGGGMRYGYVETFSFQLVD